MVKLLEVLKQYRPKSIRVASLFWKRNPKSCGYMPECKLFAFCPLLNDDDGDDLLLFC